MHNNKATFYKISPWGQARQVCGLSLASSFVWFIWLSCPKSEQCTNPRHTNYGTDRLVEVPLPAANQPTI